MRRRRRSKAEIHEQEHESKNVPGCPICNDRIAEDQQETADKITAAIMQAPSLPIHVTTESTVPQLNSVLQVIKGPHRGRLCQVGRIDLDKFRCFVVLADNGRDFFDVKPDEYILVAQPKRGMTGLKDPLDLDPQPPTTATQQPAEESPFRNL